MAIVSKPFSTHEHGMGDQDRYSLAGTPRLDISLFFTSGYIVADRRLPMERWKSSWMPSLLCMRLPRTSYIN